MLLIKKSGHIKLLSDMIYPKSIVLGEKMDLNEKYCLTKRLV